MGKPSMGVYIGGELRALLGCPSSVSPPLDMEHREKRNDRMSVPRFGGWDHKCGAAGYTSYTMIFQRARANRKENKAYFYGKSLGSEEELIAHACEGSRPKKKRLLRYLSCCGKA